MQTQRKKTMTQSDASTRLSEAEIIQLEDLLASPVFAGQALPLDQLQGFLCAVLSGPEPVPLAKWMPAALGNPKYENPAQGEEVLGLITRFHNEIETGLKSESGIGLLLSELGADKNSGEEKYDYAAWCQAYLDGVDFSEVPWEEAGDEDEINELLFAISLLAEEIEPKTLKQIKAAEMKELLAECQQDLPLIVLDIFEYFQKLRSRSAMKRH
jgi:uncharacterized protein